jgi:hypothetical protein
MGEGTLCWITVHPKLVTRGGEDGILMDLGCRRTAHFFVTFLGHDRMKMRFPARSLDRGDDADVVIWAVPGSEYQ